MLANGFSTNKHLGPCHERILVSVLSFEVVCTTYKIQANEYQEKLVILQAIGIIVKGKETRVVTS